MVVVVTSSFEQSGGDGPIDELDDAVMAQEQVIGDVTDRGWRAVAADREQELVLRTGETGRLGLFVAPVLEAAQTVAERQQPSEVLVLESSTSLRHIGLR